MHRDILDEVSQIINQRITYGDSKSSYVAELHAKGLNKILEKIIEEAGETVIAAKDTTSSGNTDALVNEVADMLFHTLVLLRHLDINLSEIYDELAKRLSISGLTEKANRSNNS